VFLLRKLLTSGIARQATLVAALDLTELSHVREMPPGKSGVRSAILATRRARVFRGLGHRPDAGKCCRKGSQAATETAECAVAGRKQRYVDGVSRRHDFKHEREALAGGQNPYAGILSCADSRIAPEYAFDSGRGDLFVCRVAGNFANTDSIASLEYGVAVLGVPLILVLGHDSCGAIDATIKSLKDNTTLPGQMPSLVAGLAPAVKAVSQQPGNLADNAIRQNVIDTVAKLKAATPILKAAVEQNKLKVAGGIYRLRDGRVDMIA
jgi:carbonic anhydrase